MPRLRRAPPGTRSCSADYADALAMAQGRRLQGGPEKIIAGALAIDPLNVKAPPLAGTACTAGVQHPGCRR